MRKLILAMLLAALAPAIAQAEPKRIEDNQLPCGNAKNSGKPSCDTKSKDIKVQTPAPTERDSVTVPPDIPAEGLPNQDKAPSAGDSVNKQQKP